MANDRAWLSHRSDAAMLLTFLLPLAIWTLLSPTVAQLLLMWSAQLLRAAQPQGRQRGAQMSMFRTFFFGSLALAALTAFATPARADWHWRHGPSGWVRFWVAPGVVVAPPPVYYAPPPVYYAPPPVVYAPPPVHYVPPIGIGIGVHIH